MAFSPCKGENPEAAALALSYVDNLEGVMLTLSGMSSLEQLKDNISFMSDFKPLSDDEHKAINKVVAILDSLDTIKCTACGYCVDGCSNNIPIPSIFKCVNNSRRYTTFNGKEHYGFITGGKRGKASDCIECGQCEEGCRP